MKQVTTTVVLAAFALVSLIIAISVHFMTLPTKDAQSELIGKVFYPEFTQPSQASSMTLTIWDGKKGTTQSFEIKKVDELWTIPSYDNYPVESAKQLTETAGSVIAIEREHLAGQSKELHQQFGVVDPKSDDAKLLEPNQIGDRIELKDDSGNTVCDLIIGNAVDEKVGNEVAEKRDLVKGNRYYVRQPKQLETYVAVLDLKISTDFADWIDSDLLQVKDATVKQLLVRNYDITEKPISLTGGDPFPVRENLSELVFEKDGFEWKLEGLKEETETLDSSPVNTLANELDSLKIIHVERKPQFPDSDIPILNGDLTANLPKGVGKNTEMQLTQSSWRAISRYGFVPSFLDGKSWNSLTVLASGGEFDFSTDDGLVYHLKFGGDAKLEKEKFEFTAGDPKPKSEKEPNDAGQDNPEAADDANDKAPGDDKTQKGKIMSVHVTFDESLIEKPTLPVKPLEPVKPVKEQPADENKKQGENKNNTEKEMKEAEKPAEGSGTGKPNEPKTGDPKTPPSTTPPSTTPPTTTPPPTVSPSEPKTEPKSAADATPKSDAGVKAKDVKETQTGGDAKTNEPAKESPAKESPEKQGDGCGADFIQEEEKQEPDAVQTKETKKSEVESKSDQSEKQEKTPVVPVEKTESAKTKQEPTDEKTDAKGKPEKQEPESPETKQDAEPKVDEFELKMQEYNTAFQKYQTDLATYNTDMTKYEEDLAAYEEKVKTNTKKVENLNERFKDWFYIVDAANLSKLKIVRADVVKPKEKEAVGPGTELPGSGDLKLPGANELPPNLRPPNLNGDPKPTDKPADSKLPVPPGPEPTKKENESEKQADQTDESKKEPSEQGSVEQNKPDSNPIKKPGGTETAPADKKPVPEKSPGPDKKSDATDPVKKQ